MNQIYIYLYLFKSTNIIAVSTISIDSYKYFIQNYNMSAIEAYRASIDNFYARVTASAIENHKYMVRGFSLTLGKILKSQYLV